MISHSAFMKFIIKKFDSFSKQELLNIHGEISKAIINKRDTELRIPIPYGYLSVRANNFLKELGIDCLHQLSYFKRDYVIEKMKHRIGLANKPLDQIEEFMKEKSISWSE